MYITKKKPLLQMAARNYKLHYVLLFGTDIQGYFMYLSTDKWIANRKRHSRGLLSYHPQYAELFRRNIYVYNLHFISFVCIHYDDVIMSVMSQSNHQHHDCSLNRLFRRRSKKTSKLRVIGLCAGNSPITGEFPAQNASNAENVSIWWRHHVHRNDTGIVEILPTGRQGLNEIILVGYLPYWYTNFAVYKHTLNPNEHRAQSLPYTTVFGSPR